jgi:hypothetical protein
MIASVVVPTWNAPDTLGASVRSALRQTVHDLEVLVVGDGVTAEARTVVAELLDEDPRVRFLDLPKAEGRGESNRDIGVREAASDAIVYLADDDLLMPRHVGNVTAGLALAPFVQSRNGYVDRHDRIGLFPTDLAEARWRAWHLRQPQRNRVSLTGTAHSREHYLSLGTGWEVPPEEAWPDLFLWQKFFRDPDLAALTLPEFTTLQFPANLHRHRTPEDFAASFARWEAFTRQPGAHEQLQEMVREVAARTLIELSAKSTDLHFEVRARDKAIRVLTAQLALAESEGAAARARVAELERILDDHRRSRSWRVTAPMRAAGALLRRRFRRL